MPNVLLSKRYPIVGREESMVRGVSGCRRPCNGAGCTVLLPHCKATNRSRPAIFRIYESQNKDVETVQQTSTGSSNVLSIFCPLLRLVSGGDAAAPRLRWLEVTTSGLASLARLPFGTFVGDEARSRTGEPAQPLQLYEFEACPFCRCQPLPLL